ncbi:GntR family transcriptional regulator [Acidianus brierleyi]|uniref:GntR family transcriptional regulator n=1 Tax=Acidianus brierleyi TaxID=41673 RepID=A0A2U9IH70_9CREN|nr:GntR family transcriptional regulator [Acidianus brierleyi]AWR95315.1 FCD domain-containing protein [Acidianus brierleyi]
MNNLTENAYNEILNSIVKGKYRQGQRLTEDQLCKDLNMSRTPVREALRMLLSEGIIKKDNKSYSVVYITAEEARMLYELRIPLEGLAARLASLRADEKDIEKMESILSKVKEETAKENPDALVLADLNGAFHEAIADATKNTYLRSCLIDIRVKLKIVRTSLFTSFERRRDEYNEHYLIFTAIKEKNPEKAENLMTEHEKKVLDFLEKRVFMYMS